ncbi:hypothetical protein [Xanthomonas sp. MUS 060]|uniref:hypothetical protein n=1 Tax=Xanthomonas sp. MUS 060 TaxID=1588031 RepID=UPI0005F28F89|nr:hypothetical protein [Xanthomonas sp. MUS 060]
MELDRIEPAAPIAGELSTAEREPPWSVAPTTAVFPCALLRWATLPFAHLDRLRLSDCLDVQKQLDADARRLLPVATRLLDDLHALVSRIAPEDKAYRRSVLQLRRDIHGQRSLSMREDLLQRVYADLQAGAVERLRHWCHAQDAYAVRQRQADAEFMEAMQRMRIDLRQLLAFPCLLHGIDMAAPGVSAHAAREKVIPEKPEPDNFERSLLGYAMRATVKTSPFSTFMATTTLDISNGIAPTLHVPALPLQARTRLNRGVVARLYALAVATGRLPCEIYPNPTLRQAGQARYQAICGRFIVLLGRPWRQQQRLHFHLHPSLREALFQARCLPARDWLAHLETAGVQTSRAVELLSQLLARGLLIAGPLFDAFDPAPEHTLLALLRSSDDPLLTQAADLLSQLIVNVQHVPGQAGQVRADAVAALEQQLLTLLGAGKSDALHNLVVEDAWSRPASDSSASGGHRALQDVAAFLAGQIGVSPAYRKLRQLFIARHGEGGRLDALLDFMLDASEQLIPRPEYGARQVQDRMEAAAPGARLAVTLQAQVIPGSHGAQPGLVVNKVFENAGWLAARFAEGAAPEQARLRRSLAQWLQCVAGTREPVDFPVAGDCNDLQSHPRLTQRVLRLPGEPVMGAGVLELQDLRLHDDPQRGELVLCDREGRELQPFYLGGTLPSPTWGGAYAFSVLSQPYCLMRPASQPTQWPDTVEIHCIPRMSVGHVVVRRACWWVRADYLRRAWFAVSGRKRLVQVLTQCEVHGLPQRFFVRRCMISAAGLDRNLLDASRKPLWVDVANPFCLSLMERLASQSAWLSVTEVLPDPAKGWLRLDGKAHVSELQFEMLLSRQASAGLVPLD